MRIAQKYAVVLVMIFTIFALFACDREVLVNFNANGGSAVESVALSGSSFEGALPVPTREGYSFDGWFYDEALSTPFATTDIVISSITVYAKWSLMSYVVTVDVDGELTTQSVTHGSDATLPVAPMRTGYNFTGWNSSTEGATDGTNITAVQTITAVFAIKTYTITFVADGVTIATRIVDHGDSVTDIPAIPEKDGMNGVWNVTVFANVTGNRTVTAIYSDNYYTITFVNSLGSTISTSSVKHGASFAAPTPPTIEGYHFVSWTGYDFASPVSGPMTVTAVYQINTFSVVFYGVTGVQIGEIQTVSWGSPATAPLYSGQTGYVVTGWDTDFSDVTHNLVIHATYTMVQYTVTFVENDGSVVTDIVDDYLNPLTAPADPTRNGYHFDGWYTDALLTHEYIFTAQSLMPLSGMTLYAGWQEASFAVAFESNGGNPIDAISVTFGDTFGLLPTPIKTGYAFEGWYATIALTGSPVVSTTSFTAFTDVTLYASWTLRQITIDYVSNGGSPVSSLTAAYGSGISAPEAPTKAGCTFAGWFRDVELTDAYSFTTMPADHLSVYAKWTLNPYTITFDVNEGTPVTAITDPFTTAVTAPESPTKEGYLFVGWCSDEALTHAYAFTTIPAADITVYAQWAALDDTRYTVDYYAEDLIGGSFTKFSTLAKYGVTDTTGTADLTVFAGYSYQAANPENVLSGIIEGSGDLVLEVYYTRNTDTEYHVNYYQQNTTGNGFTLWDTLSLTGTTGASATVANQSYEGFAFDAENLDNHLTGTIAADGGLTLDAYYLRNEFTVVLDFNSEVPDGQLTVRYQGILSALPTPTRTGYTFQGWIDETNVSYTSVSLVEGSLTLYASWRIKTFAVTIDRTMLNSDGSFQSTESDGKTVAYGVDYSPIVDIPGYYFKHVILDGVTYTDADYSLLITANVSLQVVYQLRTLTITFIQNPAGTDVSFPITVDYNGSIPTLPELTAKAGYIVVWGRTVFSNLTENMTVYAIYYAEGVESVTFMDGTTIRSIASATDNPGVDEILTGASSMWNPTKPGFKFLGWYYEADFETLVDISEMKWSVVSGSIIIYAKWETLLSFSIPTDVAVTGQTVSWTQDDLGSVMPASYLIRVDGSLYTVLAADCTVNLTTGLVSYLFTNNVLTTAGTHQISVKALGDDVNNLSSNYSLVLTKVVETTTEEPGEITETKYYDYFIVEKTLTTTTYIFYTDMIYNFSSSYTLTILDGFDYASASFNKLTTNNVPGNFLFSVQTPTGLKTYEGKVVSYINQLSLGADLAAYNATTFLNYQNPVVSPYLIGSANKFAFDLRILDNTGSRIDANACDLVYTFSLWNGTAYVDLSGTALTNLVVALPNHEFDFTNAAVGEKFQVTIAPRYQAVQVTVAPVTFEFEVNNGVNVFTNEELKLYFNDLNYELINIHSNIKAELDASQLNPDGSPLNGWATAYYDGFGVVQYDRKGNVYERLGIGINSDNLVVNGNYFTIDGSDLPYMNANSGYGTTGFSEAFEIISVQCGIFTYNVYSAVGAATNDNSLTMNNLTVIGNTVTPQVNYSLSAEEIASAEALMARNSGGMNGISVRSGSAYINNVNVGFTGVAFFSTIFGTKTDLTPLFFNTDYIHVYSSWANSYYGWAVTGFNISHSAIDKSGGAAIHIEDVLPATGVVNDPTVSIDAATEINNWVSGQEAWFKAYGMTPLVLGFKAMVDASVLPMGKTILETRINEVTGLETEMVNLILLQKAMIDAETQVEGVTVTGSQGIYLLPIANGTITQVASAFHYVTTDPRAKEGNFGFPICEYSDLTAFLTAVESLVPTIMTALSVDQDTATGLAGQVVSLASFYNLPLMIALEVGLVLRTAPETPIPSAVAYVLGSYSMPMPNQPQYLQVGTILPLDGATTSATILLRMTDIE